MSELKVDESDIVYFTTSDGRKFTIKTMKREAKDKNRMEKYMTYFNNIAGGFLFGCGLIFAAFTMRALFHMGICG